MLNRPDIVFAIHDARTRTHTHTHTHTHNPESQFQI